jgi:hypothetical protein
MDWQYSPMKNSRLGTSPPRIVTSSSSCKGVFTTMGHLTHVLTSPRAEQKVGHATALTNILGPSAAKPCNYTYPFQTVGEFINFCQILTRWGEAGVYGFLPHLNSQPSAQILLLSITTKARQQMAFTQFQVCHIPLACCFESLMRPVGPIPDAFLVQYRLITKHVRVIQLLGRGPLTGFIQDMVPSCAIHRDMSRRKPKDRVAELPCSDCGGRWWSAFSSLSTSNLSTIIRTTRMLLIQSTAPRFQLTVPPCLTPT